MTLSEELDLIRDQVNQIRLIAPADRTAEHWRTIARESQVANAESFDRCDSDGFLSQWAHQQMQLRYLDMARVADDGLTTTIPAVFDLEGNLVTTDYREGNYGPYWFIPQNEGKARFFNESEANKLTTRRNNNAKKGYRIGSARVKVNMGEYDYTLTDTIVGFESVDIYGDYIEAGRTHLHD